MYTLYLLCAVSARKISSTRTTMSTANQILNLFANSPVLCSVPRIQENVLAECDNLAQLALSHTPALSTATPTDLRISKFGVCDVAFDVRDPDVALIRHYTAKKDRAQCPAPLTSLMCSGSLSGEGIDRHNFQKANLHMVEFRVMRLRRPFSESDWYSVDGYKGIVTPGGVVLSKAKCIHDSMFGQVYVEMWEIPESSIQKGFSVADHRNLYSGGKSAIIWCMPDIIHGTLVFCDSKYDCVGA
ncbi:hypothetical protein C8F04DRAFT_1333062 [Mycena alexandri]|uniref:Uncharacterized protein n=1 Tax=Mycena alexandri TaxID=1745969 RepID=A0AAD6RZ74_9AGAR|nr:hypothetical protein C8F04DRAFT_1333062 [Mycena alexandri]